MLRIIGGTWRGRTWRFPEGDIRPTPDRVRETLFNWLTPGIAGARCLDLFAGSGALGLEALSRGAARVQFVEKSAGAARHLQQTLALWGGAQAAAAQIHVGDADAFLAAAPEAFDVVFLDPPFAAGLLDPPDAPIFCANRCRIASSAACGVLNSQRSKSSCSITTLP